MKIWKFPLKITDEQVVPMPPAAQILYVGLDPGGMPCLWAEVYEDEPIRYREVYVVGTGRTPPLRGFTYIGTIVMPPFVWHVYVGGWR